MPPEGRHTVAPASVPMFALPELSAADRPALPSSLNHIARLASSWESLLPAWTESTSEAESALFEAANRREYKPGNGNETEVLVEAVSPKTAFVGPEMVLQ